MKNGSQAIPNHYLIEERLRHHWTQQEVADQIGTTSTNYSRWERGVTSPGSHFRSQLCDLFGKSARELGLLQEELEIPEEKRTMALPSAPSAGRLTDSLSFTTLDENKSEEYGAAILAPDSSGKATPLPPSLSMPPSVTTAITPVPEASPAQPTPAPKQSGISRDWGGKRRCHYLPTKDL